MRITILANRDLASNMAINLLLQQMPEHDFVIFLSAKVGKSENLPEPLKTLGFIEQTLFNQIVFPLIDTHQEVANFANPPALSGLHFKSFQQIAAQGIAVKDIQNINSSCGYQDIVKQEPELIISIRFGQILQEPIIRMPKLGVINLHSGELPNFRGVMATFWAMLNNQKKIGTTLHFIDSSKIDAGKVIANSQQDVDYQHSYLYNVLSLYPQGVDTIVCAVNQLIRGEALKTRSMDLSRGQYFSFPDEITLNQFTRQGKRLYDYDEITEWVAKYRLP
ncbi:formyltransferase family protein [Aliiglaciecola sp. 3_MG-2023]|uniref:formyltransferase family protein n=1 Tax=Aliiglaciecola sp. 3_MG-2023 TaxID=3062644 RepID=UPI0026E32687|nr:formyltransferase family protein [Aliiglaciecola sp. 3_MG-2023]MDO6693270.1 formyltransferase family protein [Aliiglaciecola sp. 3_MG-2023]